MDSGATVEKPAGADGAPFRVWLVGKPGCPWTLFTCPAMAAMAARHWGLGYAAVAYGQVE